MSFRRVYVAVQLPEGLRGPLILHMDDRQTVSDLKKIVVARVGTNYTEMGCPDGVGRVRLSEVSFFFFGKSYRMYV